MDEVWFATGRTRVDFDRCLDTLALKSGTHSPLIAIASRGSGDAPRLVMATRSLFGFFGVSDGAALSRRLLDGSDPGSRRLTSLQAALPLDGRPRLERLRFHLGPGSEITTFMCRRVRTEAGEPLFVAAALDIRPDLLPRAENASTHRAEPPEPNDGTAAADTRLAGETADRQAESEGLPDGPLDVPAIHAALRRRWPSQRNPRFLWQSDATGICTQVSPPLAEIVGDGNAGLVGIDMFALAPQLDPSGRLESALRSQETWSGVDVAWPLDDPSVAVSVALGAIPAFDAERVFSGYRGYGIVKLDEILSRTPLRIAGGADGDGTGNVIAFPSKTLSAEDQRAFAALASELREQAGKLGRAGGSAQSPQDDGEVELAGATVQTSAAAALDAHGEPAAEPHAPAPPESPLQHQHRAGEIARNGLALLDRLATGVLVSRDNIPIFANKHLLDLTGFADEDALHAAGGLSYLLGAATSEAGRAEQVTLRHRDGASLAASTRVQRVDWDGLPATLLTVQVDAGGKAEPSANADQGAKADPPERDLAEAAGDERRELRAILETATDGVVVLDDESRVLSVNRAGEALFGRDRADVVGKPFLDLFATHDRDLARDYLEGVRSDATRSLLNHGREFLVTAAGGSADRGGRIPVFMTLGRLGPATDGVDASRPVRYCALFRDLTHWKKVEGELDGARKQAERASALKTDFLAKVSHEIRTPLTAIIGFAEVIMEERFGALGSERYKDYLRDIHSSGSHVMSLVNDLLDLSKIEAGRMELTPKSVDLNSILSDCVSVIQPQASRERVIVRFSLAPSLPRVTADERSLRQIALNLLSNAVKFNEPGGQVIVASHLLESGHVVLRIRDTGLGMSDEDITAALEPFRQLSRPSHTDVAGTGLGLPLTKALVEANEASLTIRSKIDQGTFVEVAFPPTRVLTEG